MTFVFWSKLSNDDDQEVERREFRAGERLRIDHSPFHGAHDVASVIRNNTYLLAYEVFKRLCHHRTPF